MSLREVFLGNMLETLPKVWKTKKGKTFHYIAGIPDSAEIVPRPTLIEYIKLLKDFSNTIFECANKNSIFFFLQTDKYNKDPPMWIDKMFYISQIAIEHGFLPFCKKIIINDFKPNDSSRSVYTNLYGFMKVDKNIYKRNPEFMRDEIIYNGNKTWINGFAVNAVDLCVRFIKKNSRVKDYYIIDPFIGEGSLLAVSDLYGVRSIGIDIEKEKVESSRKMKITREELDKFMKFGENMIERLSK